MRSAAATLAFGLLAGGSAASAEHAWQWPLQLDAAGQPTYLVALDETVYAAASDPLLRDIDIVDADGRAMPAAMQSALPAAQAPIEVVAVAGFLLPESTPATPEQLRARFTGTDLSVELHGVAAAPAATSVPLLLDLGEGHRRVEALRLDPDIEPQAGWMARFVVEGSSDLQQWRTLVAGFDAYRLNEQGQQLTALRIGLPGEVPRYLRLSAPPRGQAGRLRGVSAERRAVAAPLPPLRWSRLEATAEGDASWTFRAPGPVLVERWRLRNTAERWLGNLVLQSRGRDGEPWQTVAEVVSYRMLIDGVTLEDGEHVIAARRDREWRLQWRGPAPAAPQLELGWRPDHLLFMAEGREPYRLVAGSSTARRIDAPTSAALAALRASRGADWRPAVATLGARGTLAGERALKAPPDPQRWSRVLLWTVLLAVAASVLVMALRLLRSAPTAG